MRLPNAHNLGLVEDWQMQRESWAFLSIDLISRLFTFQNIRIALIDGVLIRNNFATIEYFVRNEKRCKSFDNQERMSKFEVKVPKNNLQMIKNGKKIHRGNKSKRNSKHVRSVFSAAGRSSHTQPPSSEPNENDRHYSFL